MKYALVTWISCVAGWSCLAAAAVTAVGCSSGGGGSSPGGGGGASPTCNVATLPANNLVDNVSVAFSVDSTGIAFGTLAYPLPPDGGSPGLVGSSSLSGSVSTFPLPSEAMPGHVESDADNVYFMYGGFDPTPAPGLYSLPHDMTGAPRPILAPSGSSQT